MRWDSAPGLIKAEIMAIRNRGNAQEICKDNEFGRKKLCLFFNREICLKISFLSAYQGNKEVA